MKVCFVLEHYHPHVGGAETITRGMTSWLVKLGCEVKVITSNSGGIDGMSLHDGVEVYHFPWRSFFGHPVPDLKDMYETVEWADIVHTTTYTAAPRALKAARRFDKPCLLTVYEALGNKWFWVESNYLKASLFFCFERYVIRKKFSLYHAISRATGADLIECGIPSGSITTIYPGLRDEFKERDAGSDSPMSARADERSKDFLFFGRPGKTKGIFILYEAIKRARERLPDDFRFVFVLSDDPLSEKNRLKRLVEEEGLTGRVVIQDSLPKEGLIRAIRDSFCVVVPSITEGFGFSAAETCALGKPIITSDGGSLPEAVSGRVLFFQNRNSEDLARKIMLATKGEFAIVADKRFDWRESTEQLLAAYEGLLAGRRQEETVSLPR
ncbi:MAG TPA: glycosyltransferase family 4 protein [Blastocatellia bacterium]|nr:glycosyltransferase family 4 protein [Blastocatellia bacterium]